MEIFFFWLILAVLIGVWASNRGRSGFGYFLLAAILSPLIGALILLIAGPKPKEVEARAIESGELKKCPACAELVRAEARKCKHCGEALPANPFV
jgi:uncharacterized membrane protein YiaA